MKTQKSIMEEHDSVQLISICILCNGNEENLQTCTSAFKNSGCELILINAGSDLSENEYARSFSVPVLRFNDANSCQAANNGVQKASGRWILILRSDERFSSEDVSELFNLCKSNNEECYYLLIEKPPSLILPHFDPGIYEWVGNRGKFSSQTARANSCVTSPEPRLFNKMLFDHFVPGNSGSITPVFKKQPATLPISTIRIRTIDTFHTISSKSPEADKSLEDYDKFIGNYEEDLSNFEGFQFLSPNSINYSLISEKNYPGLAAGLEKGWGNVYLLKFMIFAFIKQGSYEKAINFADRMLEKFGDQLEIWRLKAAAYFYQLDLENAEKAYKKALSIKDNDQDILFNLAKVFLIKKKYDAGKHILETLINYSEMPNEVPLLLKFLEEKGEGTAKLSLLMLCKDEEKHLKRALDSIKNVVDEIVLVDTGSTDMITSVAKEYGAKVIEHKWNDHFGEARNAGLRHVTGDYVLSMDADEYIDNDTIVSLLVFKSILSLVNKKGVVFEIKIFKDDQEIMKNLPPQNVVTRTAVFPSLPGIHFSGRIFESVDESLGKCNIEYILVNSAYFIHIGQNTDMGIKRKTAALEKANLDRLYPEDKLKGISHFLNVGNTQKAGEWFEHTISEIKNKRKYHHIVYHLTSIFEQNGYLAVNTPIFMKLCELYNKSYQVMSFCAQMLYQADLYSDAERFFSTLIRPSDSSFYDQPNKQALLRNIMYLALSYLENNQFKECDKTLELLTREDSMRDSLQSILFYSEIRQKNIEEAISILDSWIRSRNLSINATIENFPGLLNIILKITEMMSSYGQTDAASVLSRSAQYLAETME